MCVININIHARQLFQNGCVIWIDNFSKYRYRAHQVPSMEKGTYTNMLWTGMAYSKPRADVNMSMMQTPDGEDIPAMPDNLFEMEEQFLALYKTICPDTLENQRMHRTSMAHKLKVRNVPPKPCPTKVRSPNHKKALTDSHGSLARLYPADIMPINIGENKTFLKILRDHYEATNQHIEGGCDRYYSFNADIDIFDRTLKAHTRPKTQTRVININKAKL